MHHPNSDTKNWPLIWFAKYSLYYGIFIVFLTIAFAERERWFFGLSLYLIVAIAFFAWRAANKGVKLRWRVGLAMVICVSYTFSVLVVYAPQGDTLICFDRLSQAHRWAPIQNLGPDPNCRGIPLRNLKTN